MSLLDIFGDDGGAFGVVSLTAAVNDIPFKPMRISQLGLFREQGVSTLTVAIERRGSTLALIPTSARGAPGFKNVSLPNNLVSARVTHVKFGDDILAEEVMGVRRFGSEDGTETVQERVNQKLAEMAAKHDLTVEWHRIGALKGQVLDADGSTVLWDMFTTFGVTAQTEIDFDLDNASPATAALLKKCGTVIGKIEDELGGLTYDHVHAIVSQEFWDDLITHKEIRDTYQATNAAQLRDVNMRAESVLTYGGITFERYRGGVGATRFVAADKAHFFPVGVPDLFLSYYGPADYIETVNTIGLPRYAKQKRMEYDRGISIETQSNPLHLCTRPRVLIPARRT